MATKNPPFLTYTTRDEIRLAKREVSSAQCELENAILDEEEVQSRVIECQGILEEAQEELDELLEDNDMKEYEDEDISNELPVLALMSGYSLLLITYRNCRAVTEVILKNKKGEEVRMWTWLPSLADLFEATR